MGDERMAFGRESNSPDSGERDEADSRAIQAVISSLSSRGHLDLSAINLEVLLAFVSGNFSTAFIQALGQRAADGAAKRVGDLVQKFVKGKPDEYHIGVDDGSAATIAITADTPDEARLALLDLDVTANDLHGKVLRWDSNASAWRPDPGDK